MTLIFTATTRSSGLLASRTTLNTALFTNQVRRKPNTFVFSRTSQRSSTTNAYQEAGRAAGAGAKGATGNPFKRAFQWYAEKLETHPVITKGITAGFMGAAGDVMCQVLIDKPEKEYQKAEAGESLDDLPSLWWFESGRTTRFFVLGVGLVGPWCHAWYKTLARILPKTTPSHTAGRVALDQFAFTPIILPSFISSLWTLERVMGDDDVEKRDQPLTSLIPERLATTLPDCIVANWCLWIPCQLINFRFVPQSYQVLYANMVSLVWNMYLSFSTRGAEIVEPEVEEKILVEKVHIPANLAHRLSQRRMKELE